MRRLFKFLSTLYAWFNKTIDMLIPAGDLFLRLWVATMFFSSGLTKIKSWSSTLFLFTYEYHVPLLPPNIAALLATATELVLPVFIVLGLGRRIPAFILFIFNIIAVLSYPFLLSPAGSEGLEDHFFWGIILGVIILHGYGKWSIDHLIQHGFKSTFFR